ncbi:MAG TPA: FecR domain-containing protein, partial [Puia sp.]|nr:FecR domain-containing protein [Puia sp.]
GQFQLILPDGTKVWLNAASRIKYPVAFSGNQRQVEISGEVYFEVTKDATKPFKVKTGETMVEVLGTHFNINDYPEEGDVKTTLLEGSVKVSGGGVSKQIIPGQQAVISGQGIRIIPEVDVTSIVAWKNGRTLFKDATIPQIMGMISRWYDVDVEYAGTIPDKTLNGGIPRTATLNQLIKVLETYGVHIKKEGKKIIVMP